MTTTDPTTPDEHADYRITVISNALFDHQDSWATVHDGAIAFDTDCAALIAIQALEKQTDREREKGCRYECHIAEQEANIKAVRDYAEYSDHQTIGEQFVLVIMDEVE